MNADEVALSLAKHEVQCEERWKTAFQRLEKIDDRLAVMETRMLQFGGALLVFLGGVIVTMTFGG